MKPDLTALLGQIVRVVVDRPLGSVHPRHPGLVYPVNSGELPGTLSGDGHPIDAYLLGCDSPLEEAEGVVAAVIVREDDVEDKLVVVPPGTRWSDRIAPVPEHPGKRRMLVHLHKFGPSCLSLWSGSSATHHNQMQRS